MTFYGAFTKIDETGQPISIGFPYSDNAVKVRTIADKNFHSIGDMTNAPLFGQSKFQAGQSRAITITEGELDAMSVFQMLNGLYPSVSVRSASSAKKDCTKARDYLNSFDKIYLCFDADEPGRLATQAVASLFDFNKVYVVKLTSYKDANEFLQNGNPQDFLRVWQNSKRLLLDGISSTFEEFDALLDRNTQTSSVPYPFPTLQRMTYGIRQGETTLLTALEGVGKTEIFRAIEYSVLKNTKHNVGVIHLEESETRYLQGLAGYELKSPCHLPDTSISHDQIKEAYRAVILRPDRLHLHAPITSGDPDFLLDRFRFLASACDCKYIFFDHITLAVTGILEADQNKLLDYVSTKMKMLVEELGFGLVFISHVNDDGLTRGSRNISKIAHTWIHLDRNVTADSEAARNLTHLTVRKNRFAHHTGPAGTLVFDPETYIVSEQTRELPA